MDATYLPRLEQGWGREAHSLMRALGQERMTFDLRPNGRREAVAAVFRSPLSAPEMDFYRRHLVEGGPYDPTTGRQRRLAALIEARPPESSWPSRPSLARLVEDASVRGWDDVADLLQRITACESVLAPASMLFSWLLGRDGAHLDDVVTDLRTCWGDRLDSAHPHAASVLANQEWRDIAGALLDGDYPRLVRSLAQRNATVMRERGGALPWLEVTDQDRLRVRFRDEPADLPTADEIRELWWYPYFLPSLVAVLWAVEEGLS